MAARDTRDAAREAAPEDTPRLPRPVACPSCGYVSDDIRCPRCNALKLAGCTGSCRTCPSACDARS
jgi:predicted Zn-ribbon and HTH transcriptional regulator